MQPERHGREQVEQAEDDEDQDHGHGGGDGPPELLQDHQEPGAPGPEPDACRQGLHRVGGGLRSQGWPRFLHG